MREIRENLSGSDIEKQKPEESKKENEGTPESKNRSYIQEMKNDANDISLEGSKKILKDSIESIKLDPEVQKEILKGNGVFEKLQKISERISEVLESAKARIKKTLAIGMATMALSGAGDFGEARAESAGEDMILAAEIKNTPEGYEKLIEEIRKYAIEKGNEAVFLVQKSGERVKLQKSVDGDSAIGFVDFVGVKEFAKKGKVEIIHTHHAAMTGYSQKEIDEIEAGKTKALLMPPSITDIISLGKEEEYFGDSSGEIKNKVVDPFGSWEYGYEKNNKFALLLKEFDEELSLENIINNNISDNSEKEMHREMIRREFGVDPAFINALSLVKGLSQWGYSKKILVDFVKKIESAVNSKKDELRKKYPESFNDLEKIIDNETMITEYKSNQLSIEENIRLYKKHGINLEYKPFKNKNNQNEQGAN